MRAHKRPRERSRERLRSRGLEKFLRARRFGDLRFRARPHAPARACGIFAGLDLRNTGSIFFEKSKMILVFSYIRNREEFRWEKLVWESFRVNILESIRTDRLLYCGELVVSYFKVVNSVVMRIKGNYKNNFGNEKRRKKDKLKSIRTLVRTGIIKKCTQIHSYSSQY